MTLLGMSFEQAAISFGWGNLIDFARHLKPESATYRAQNREMWEFSTDMQQSALLADVFDAIMALAYMFAGKGAKKPERYPRPWAKQSGETFGKDPIPISEFNKWYYGGD